MVYREAPAPPGTCPRCRETLLGIKRDVHGAFMGHALPGVRWCEKCGGVFADVAASQRIIEQMDRDLLEVGFQAGLGKTRRRDEGRTISCPECQFEMVRTRVESANCVVDACASHGTWFDSGELVDVMRAYAKARKAGLRFGPRAPPTPPAAPEVEADRAALEDGKPDVSLVDFVRWLFT